MFTLSSRANIVAIFVLFLGLVYPLNDPYCFRSAYDFQCKRICCSELIEQIKDQGLRGMKIVNVDIAVADKTVYLEFADGSVSEFLVRNFDHGMEAVIHTCIESNTPVSTRSPCPRPWLYWIIPN